MIEETKEEEQMLFGEDGESDEGSGMDLAAQLLYSNSIGMEETKSSRSRHDLTHIRAQPVVSFDRLDDDDAQAEHYRTVDELARPRGALFDAVEEVKQNYGVLNEETLGELEEIAPEDLYSYDERFNAAVDVFFSEADFEDAFSCRIQDLNYDKVLTTIDKVRLKCQSELVSLNTLIREQNLHIQRSNRTNDPSQASQDPFQEYFREYANDLLDAYIGIETRRGMTEEQLLTAYALIMQLFLQQTQIEVDFILNEILLLSRYFDERTLFPVTQTASHNKFFSPSLDSDDMPVKADCVAVLKRAIFKLASTFERINHFTSGVVRARSVNLDVIKSDVKDSIDLLVEVNPFKARESLSENQRMAKNLQHDIDTYLLQSTGLQSNNNENQPHISVPRGSVNLKTDKKDLLRIYSVSKHIFNEIQRLNKRNKDKKVLAKRIIKEMHKIVHAGRAHLPFNNSYQLGNLRQSKPRNVDDWMARMREGKLPRRQLDSKLRELWTDFTASTSFKSKANCLEDASVDRGLFLLLDLDFTKNPEPYDYTICLQLLHDKDEAVSLMKRFSIKGCRQRQTASSQHLFLKVPFKMVCTKHVAIIAKVFKGRMNDPSSFSILDSHSVIKVSQIFWQEGLRCSVPNSVQKQPMVFYESHRDLPIERVYRDFFNEQTRNMHTKHKKCTYEARYKITLLSNLQEVSQGLELEHIIPVPPQDFSRQTEDYDMFSESRLICNFDARLPNRPYTFEQGLILRDRMKQVFKDIHELFVEIDSFATAQSDSERALRIRACIESASPSLLQRQNDRGNYNPTTGKIYRQLDERYEPGENGVYLSPLFPIIDHSCRVKDSFMIGLPWNLDALNGMSLHIDIQLVDWNPQLSASKRLGFIPKKLTFRDVIEEPGNYTVKTKYRKTVHLGSYNELNTVLFAYGAGDRLHRLAIDSPIRINMRIVPYSSYDLLNEGLRQVLKAFGQWTSSQDTDFKIIREGVFQVQNIKPSAHRLLSVLCQVFMTMEKMDDQFLEIFKSIVYVLRKLDLLPNNEGARILHLFLKEYDNHKMLVNLYPKLLDALLHISQQLFRCANEDRLIENPRLLPLDFYSAHLQAFQMLPTLLQIVAAGYSLEIEEIDDLQRPIYNESELPGDDSAFSSHILESRSVVYINRRTTRVTYRERDPRVVKDRFLLKVKDIFEQLGNATKARNSLACFILQRLYFENMPALFDFVATYFQNEFTNNQYLKAIIKEFLSPLWGRRSRDSITHRIDQDWLCRIYRMVGASQAQIVLGQNKVKLNPFVLKTIAIAKIIQSQTMLLLPMNPEFGEDIAHEFCRFFSENIEDYRIMGDRSLPMQGFHSEEDKLDPKIFYHTALFFLNSYMKFENNFVRFSKGKALEETKEEGSPRLMPMEPGESSIRFEEERIAEMSSQSYLVQDSDQFIKLLLKVMETNPQDLPEQLKTDKTGLADRNKVAIYQLLQSLSVRNMQRLLERSEAQSDARRSTRKNLRDLLQNILSVLYSEKLEFMPPFQRYGEQYQFTVISNFATQLCFVLLRRQKERQKQVSEFRPIFSQLWLTMLLNFVNTRKRISRQLKRHQSPAEYFEESGKLFQTTLFFMKEAKLHDPSILKLSKLDVYNFKLHVLPGLIKILSNEAQSGTFNTLDDVLQLLLIYDEMMSCGSERVRKPSKSANAAHKQFDLLSVVVDIAEELLVKSKRFKRQVQPTYPFEAHNNHSDFQTILLTALRKIIHTEGQQRKDEPSGCNLCNQLFKPDPSLYWSTFDLSEHESHCKRCRNFISFLKKFKLVEKRRFLYEASRNQRPEGSKYDLLYNAYTHYMLVRTKLQYSIFSQSKTPRTLFLGYVQLVQRLQDLMQSEFDSAKSRRHLKTELAFCHVRQMQEDQRLLDSGRSYINERERHQKKVDLVKELPFASQQLIQVGFNFEAIKLNQMSFELTVEDINKDAQTANYLQHMLYYDDVFMRRGEIENRKADFIGEKTLLSVFDDMSRFKQGYAIQNSYFNTLLASQLLASPPHHKIEDIARTLGLSGSTLKMVDEEVKELIPSNSNDHRSSTPSDLRQACSKQKQEESVQRGSGLGLGSYGSGVNSFAAGGDAIPMQAIIRDQLIIAQGIEESQDDYNCSYWHLKFFGQRFAPELRYSPHGFILRAKSLQEISALTEELNCIYQIDVRGFLAEKGATLNIKNPANGQPPEADQENPLIVLVPMEPLTERIQQAFGKGDRSENGTKLLQKTINHGNQLVAGAHQNFSDYNYKKNFYAKYFLHDAEFQEACYAKINENLSCVLTEQAGVMNKEECFAFFAALMQMQDGVSSKGEKDPAKFWRKVQRIQKETEQVEEVAPSVKITYVRQAAYAHWDDLADYKNAIITVYEVEDTFPAIFFLQEIKDNVINVKINCIQEATEKIKNFKVEAIETLTALAGALTRYFGNEGEGKVKELLNSLYRMLQGHLNATVGDGLKTYMGLFFARDGYNVLETENPNYHMLLELFKALESFLGTLNKGLETLDYHSDRLVPHIFASTRLREDALNLYSRRLDEFYAVLRGIRERSKIDLLMAQERDRLQTDSEDSDY